MFTLIGLIIGFSCLIVAVTVHEFAHAFAADRLGDPTARSYNRLTLDPRAHVDPIGTIALPLSLLLISGGSFSYGWGKPTPFDAYNLKNPKRDIAVISLAGPLSNILIAIISAVLLRLFPGSLSILLLPMILTNLSLAVFNIIPVGPLDGQKILYGLLPQDLASEFQDITNRYGNLILILLLLPLFGESPVNAIINPVLNFLLRIFLP